MYVMLSGPMAMQSKTSHLLNKNGGINLQQSSVHSFHSEISSQINDKQQNEKESSYWFLMLPYINDWIPSIGFSAIILSTMYFIVKYQKGRFIGIGQPRVLRNNH